MFCGLNAKTIIALYLILKIWSQKFGVSSFHFCSEYLKNRAVTVFICFVAYNDKRFVCR